MTAGKQEDDPVPPKPPTTEANGATHDLLSGGNRDALRELLEQAARARAEAALAAAAAKQGKPRRRR